MRKSNEMPGRTRLFATLLFSAGAAASHAQSVTELGAHTLITHSEGMGVSPAVSDPIDTAASGSAFITFNAGYASNSTRPQDSFGNRWKAVGGPVTYRDYGDTFSVQAYVAMNAKGGAKHTLRFDKPGDPVGELTAPFIEVRNAGVLQDVAQNYPQPGLVLTSGKVTTTGPATLVAVWWGDGGVKRMTTQPSEGFTMIDSYLMLPDNSGVQAAVAVRQVDQAGTYNVSWIGSPIQGAILWLFAFQANK
ncbi:MULTISPECIES: hypothetical protein [Dyella]|uniref:DUF4198 domain-containing protein n=2 Tax=Dyella TaxID=231454 RepID=A0A4R0YJB0_9GAMM|nr:MULTISPECIES: hypothetical protein [Dyella]TBR36186.1 hypothetical protein EYV96_16475 [Dyella terrae]TCI06235.1 hypothetical protein EZM97_35565 [Dyella soli]